MTHRSIGQRLKAVKTDEQRKEIAIEWSLYWASEQLIKSHMEISDLFYVLNVVKESKDHGYVLGATWFDIDDQNSVRRAMPKSWSDIKARAFMKMLDKLGLITGCHCGCRGDYLITDKGISYLNFLALQNKKPASFR